MHLLAGSFLLSKNGAAVPLSELGLQVKRPPQLAKKSKLLPVLQADARFKWYELPRRPDDASKVIYLAVAVAGPTGVLAEVHICPRACTSVHIYTRILVRMHILIT
jgi:hypothetical protein